MRIHPPRRELYAAEYEGHCARLASGELAVLDGLWMGNVSARRDDVLRVGLASARFPVRWHADTDFGVRLGEAGARGVFDPDLGAVHADAGTAAAYLRDAHERGEGAWYLARAHRDRFGDVSPDPFLANLPAPARAVASFLGHEPRSRWTGRLLMTAGGWAERLGWPAGAERLARLARRVLFLCGYRCAAAGTAG